MTDTSTSIIRDLLDCLAAFRNGTLPANHPAITEARDRAIEYIGADAALRPFHPSDPERVVILSQRL